MDSTTIKLEPGRSSEERVAVTYTKIDIDYPLIKEECSESIWENIPDKKYTTEHSLLESVTIKAEPEIKDEKETAILYSEIDIELPDIKQECSENSDRSWQTAGASFGINNIISVQQKRDEDFKNLKPFRCSMCDRKLGSKVGLVAHILTHSKEKPFSCSYCSSSFAQKHHLTRHNLIHSKLKPFSCSNCNYSCSQKSSLTRHTRTHTKEKPFSCSYCSSSFSQKSILTNHNLTHTKEKPFSCSFCNYSCSRKSSLTIHTRTHNEEKPFLL